MNDDMQGALPPGWVRTTLEKVCTKIQDGTHFSPKVQYDEPGERRYLYVTAKNIRASGLDLSDITYVDEAFHKAIYARCDPRMGDVLLTKDGVNTGVAAVNELKDEFSLLSSVALLRPHPSLLDSYYLKYYLSSPTGLSSITGEMTGTAIKRIILAKIRPTNIPIAPLDEQHRIVAKLDELLTRLDAGVAALKRAQANLKRYKASVLKASCEGKLVPTEAELARAEGRTYESADELLKRILSERRAKWEADLRAKGKDPSKVKYIEPQPPDTSGLPDLPEGWCWTTPEQLANVDKYSLAIGPFGSNLKVSDYTSAGVPLVFVRNIRSGCFTGLSTKYVSARKADELHPHVISPGDILITKMGDPPGDACLYPMGLPNAIITADCIKWKLSSHIRRQVFFVHVINSRIIQTQIAAMTIGVAQQKISLERFKTLALPVPPLSEQERIVEEIDKCLSVIETTEITITNSILRAERLRQAILRRAFSGKLVPQDPNDEPAGALLERIRDERNNDANTKRIQRKPSEPRLHGEGKSMKDKVRRALWDVLKGAGKSLTPLELFNLAGFDAESIEQFYQELHEEVCVKKRILQLRPNDVNVYLEAVNETR